MVGIPPLYGRIGDCSLLIHIESYWSYCYTDIMDTDSYDKPPSNMGIGWPAHVTGHDSPCISSSGWSVSNWCGQHCTSQNRSPQDEIAPVLSTRTEHESNFNHQTRVFWHILLWCTWDLGEDYTIYTGERREPTCNMHIPEWGAAGSCKSRFPSYTHTVTIVRSYYTLNSHEFY